MLVCGTKVVKSITQTRKEIWVSSPYLHGVHYVEIQCIPSLREMQLEMVGAQSQEGAQADVDSAL